MIKSFFKLTHQEKKASIYFMLVIVIVVGVKQVFLKSNDTSILKVVKHEEQRKKEVLSVEKELKQYSLSDQEVYNADGVRSVKAKVRLTFPDSLIIPNHLSIDDWTQIGFSKGQARGLSNYLQSIGWVSSSEEIEKIYVLDDYQKMLLSDKINYQKKDINLMNKEDFIRIKGIGEFYASKIISNRELLGGYISYDQILDLYGIDSLIIRNIRSKTVIKYPVRKLPINSLSFDELRKHPYIGRSEAKLIIRSRSVSRLESIDDLFKTFSDSSKTMKLNPYLSYD